MPTPVESFAPLYDGLKRRNGLDLNLYKQDQLQRRIRSMMETRGMKTIEDFAKLVLGTDAEQQWFLDKLAINVSELFRNPEKWVEMEKIIIPELLSSSSRLKCWSAGCSFGAEAHTLAVLLDSKFKGSHTVLGTDIDKAALDQANRGEFSENDMRGVPTDLRKQYFKQNGLLSTAEPTLKKYLTFKKGNLLADQFDSGFDLIMCRNVVIYFNESAKEKLYERFYAALKPGGYLFVGSTERIFNAKEIGLDSKIPFFYRKPLEGNKLWRNAS